MKNHMNATVSHSPFKCNVIHIVYRADLEALTPASKPIHNIRLKRKKNKDKPKGYNSV